MVRKQSVFLKSPSLYYILGMLIWYQLYGTVYKLFCSCDRNFLSYWHLCQL